MNITTLHDGSTYMNAPYSSVGVKFNAQTYQTLSNFELIKTPTTQFSVLTLYETQNYKLIQITH